MKAEISCIGWAFLRTRHPARNGPLLYKGSFLAR
ncbi:hypothetical protein E1A91_A07G011100v1 [Gossypium mustelinum]|uniref:Nidogen G2 beta-barrel domain-containing protein n=1 Tax=Gossypium mustelinum TaxID=34275 RepID=A0A5D2YFG9_GOSMU|nr:hypothetical protein E1A91_A07G011100v1 [Gossypium mustelinum]